MTDLIGSSQTLITPDNTFVFEEQSFVGIEGYTRKPSQFPRLGDTSTGTTNYRQGNSTQQIHDFNWDLVLDDNIARLLISDIEQQVLRYKENNARNFAPFLLRDERLAYFVLDSYPITISPTTTLNENTIPGIGGWAYCEFKILITSISWDCHAFGKTRVSMAGTELPI